MKRNKLNLVVVSMELPANTFDPNCSLAAMFKAAFKLAIESLLSSFSKIRIGDANDREGDPALGHQVTAYEIELCTSRVIFGFDVAGWFETSAHGWYLAYDLEFFEACLRPFAEAGAAGDESVDAGD
ncbi:hypothetical protein FRB96_002828 [Tulasnella sp. 330]|nr:hypothetical protein FRB96_002828 [Tulasnella sp. 330]KAG8870718.1 hypothetical protein FRB97_009434 [Tulasnella sp. 331]KAG8883437.1 hypothetical protein FRB98_003133 [Tulasnella sp. 332]